jgi:hypothetical protein
MESKPNMYASPADYAIGKLDALTGKEMEQVVSYPGRERRKNQSRT